MTGIDADLLKPWARRYLWWQSPERALQKPLRVIAQVMNIGDYDDVQSLIREVGTEPFVEAIAQAEAGQFNDRSWAYWHYRLGLAQPQNLPAPPPRCLP
ncbi:MAG: hypothetical protein L0H83_08630 [Salinisphaera sp.]|nr:hypothetical protein [Salinisphaera sp.]